MSIMDNACAYAQQLTTCLGMSDAKGASDYSTVYPLRR
jgi:hypothetical protein